MRSAPWPWPRADLLPEPTVVYFLTFYGVGWMAALVAGIVGLVAFEKLVRLQRIKYPQDWERSGRPEGYFSWRSDSDAWQRAFTRRRVYREWARSPQPWMIGDERAVRLQRILRASWYAALAGAILLLGTLGVVAVIVISAFL